MLSNAWLWLILPLYLVVGGILLKTNFWRYLAKPVILVCDRLFDGDSVTDDFMTQKIPPVIGGLVVFFWPVWLALCIMADVLFLGIGSIIGLFYLTGKYFASKTETVQGPVV